MSATSVDQVPAARTPLSPLPGAGAWRAAARRPPLRPSLPAAMGSGGRSAPAMAAPARPRQPLFITAGPRQLRSASPLRGPARPGGSASARAASEPSPGPVGARFLSPLPERFARLSLVFPTSGYRRLSFCLSFLTHVFFSFGPPSPRPPLLPAVLRLLAGLRGFLNLCQASAALPLLAGAFLPCSSLPPWATASPPKFSPRSLLPPFYFLCAFSVLCLLSLLHALRFPFVHLFLAQWSLGFRCSLAFLGGCCFSTFF